MAFIHYEKHQIRTQVVFWGGRRAGATSALRWVYERTKGPDAPATSEPRDDGGQMYDQLPLRLGEIRGFETHVLLVTVPTAPENAPKRALLVKGTDGVVLVAASTPLGVRIAQAALAELDRTLAAAGYRRGALPFVTMFTHRDAPDALPIEACANALGVGDAPFFEAVPSAGVGVFDTLKAITKLVLTELKNEPA